MHRALRLLTVVLAAIALIVSSSAPGSAQRRGGAGGGGLKLLVPQIVIGGVLATAKASKPRRERTPAAQRTKRQPTPQPRVAKPKPERTKSAKTAKPSRPLVSRPPASTPPGTRPKVVTVPPRPPKPTRPSFERNPAVLVPGALVGGRDTGRTNDTQPPSLPPGPDVRLGPVAIDATEIPDEVLIAHQPSTSDTAIDALAQRFGLTVLERSTVALLGLRVVRLLIPDGRSPVAVAQVLATEPGIEGAQPNHIYRRQQSNTSAAPQYAISKLAADGAGVRASGRGVAIAVIDTGVDATHPDLRAVAVESRDLLGETARDDAAAHATAIAGIIAADGVTRGIARGARILSLRAFAAFAPRAAGRPQRSTSMVVVKAIDAAIADGANVLNLSFAGPSDALLERMLGAAEQRDVVAVAAAGNGGADAKPAYPAAYPGVIAVTATDALNRLYHEANRGPYVTVAAPGVEVLAASADHGHELVSGTSFATAHVSALAALLLEQAPSLTPADIRKAIVETAVDLGEPGRDEAFGAGLANAEAALAHRLVAGGPP